MKAEDVVYSVKRWIDPETKSPVSWRAGKVDDITATDDYTVEYKLNAPYSELLYQLTQSFAVIIDKDTVAKRSAPTSASRASTAPARSAGWSGLPRNEMKLKQQRGLQMGPAALREPRARPCPRGDLEDRAGGEHAPRRPHDRAEPDHAVRPLFRLPHHRAPIRRPSCVSSKEAFWTYFMGFKIDKPEVNDERCGAASCMAVDQAAHRQEPVLRRGGACLQLHQPAGARLGTRSVDAELIKTDVAGGRTSCSTRPAGKGPDGFRMKDGKKIDPLLYGFTGSSGQRLAEAVQGDLRKVGIDMKVQLFDATVGLGQARHAGVRRLRHELSLHLAPATRSTSTSARPTPRRPTA